MAAHQVSPRFTSRQARAGLWLFGAGLAVCALAAWENSTGLPFAMPGFWHSQRTLCLLVALAVSTAGWFVIVNGPRRMAEPQRRSEWRPARAGRRFHSLVVYSRNSCHLCEEAVELLQSYSAYLPPVQEIDIDTDPELRARFDTEVPVVALDGKVRFKSRVSEVLLQRLIEGTPPA